MNLGLIAFWADERDRWPLWLPVALGAGAGGYFALPVEPSITMGWAALAAALPWAIRADGVDVNLKFKLKMIQVFASEGTPSDSDRDSDSET